ncbi:MAG: ribonuclease HII [Caldimicrobium sp.]|nr:ribonuclease HII [Caldimicrobium sp.]MCX7612821.1 ribonuclease HII [Caldimicrobium sp.]MDW8183307.1 ribonuclease HII [Caldimicrobium sp.]
MIKRSWNNLKSEPLEKFFWSQGFLRIAGIDEAGRGAIAGPIFVGLVIFPKDYSNPLIKDSKTLTEKQRENLFEVIIKEALSYGVAKADTEEINNLGLMTALFLAMRRALAQVREIDLLLVDGPMGIPEYRGLQRAIVKGDSLSLSIAGGSILAKVTRDAYMRGLAKLYPDYGFEKHKGYATSEHLEAIRLIGPCPEHRIGYKCFKSG